MKKIIIAAVDDNGVIGLNGKLPWRSPVDLRWFKNTTLGHAVIMGRKTYEGCPALPDRTTIVVSKSMKVQNDPYKSTLWTTTSLTEAFLICSVLNHKKIFICGGADIYKQSFSLVDEMWITHIPGEHKGDVMFPMWPIEWECIETLVPTPPNDGTKFCHYLPKRLPS